MVLGGVAQLVRASACHAEGREFESRHSRHSNFRIESSLFVSFSGTDVVGKVKFKLHD